MTPPAGLERGKANFRSSDSFAGGLAHRVSHLRAVKLLLTFSILSLLQIWAFELGLLDEIFPAHDYVLGPYSGGYAIAIRAFVLAFFIAFAIYASGSIRARLILGLDLVVRFLALCALLDLGSAALIGYIGIPYPLLVLQILAGMLGFGVFAYVILKRGVMPEAVPVEVGPQPNTRALYRLLLGSLIGAGAAIWASGQDAPLIDGLKRVALLGGVGPGVILFILVTFAVLYAIAVAERRRLARREFSAPLTVIVPAFNERYVIAQTIRAIGVAAENYDSPVEVLVIDNGSVDDTLAIAEAEIAACASIEGRVISMPEPGKAHALNAGMEHAGHDFVVRIDADTQVRPDTFKRAMQNFADPKTGAVGGVPLPPGGAIFDGPRLVEVLIKHGYYSPSLGAVAGLVGIPGMFVIYRAEALRRAGPFASGMNGEDTDVSLRIAELGYRTLVDHRVSYVSEVPTSFAHLREQRLRWYRSVYHVSARAYSLLASPKLTIRSKLVLPYMLMNTARRMMMLPLVIFGAFEIMITAHPAQVPTWQAVAAVLIGSPTLVAIIAVVVSTRLHALLHIPSYILFRALRSWFTLESALTIPISTEFRRVALLQVGAPAGGDLSGAHGAARPTPSAAA